MSILGAFARFHVSRLKNSRGGASSLRRHEIKITWDNLKISCFKQKSPPPPLGLSVTCTESCRCLFASLRVSWQVGAPDGGWRLGARPVRGRPEDCSAGRARRWVLHHIGGTNSFTRSLASKTIHNISLYFGRRLYFKYVWSWKPFDVKMLSCNSCCNMQMNMIIDIWTKQEAQG